MPSTWNLIIRRGKEKRIKLLLLRMCARTLVTTVTIITLKVTQKQNVIYYIYSLILGAASSIIPIRIILL